MASKKKVYATHVTTPTGKRLYVRGKTKEELDRKVFEAKVQMNAGVDITSDTCFSDYARVWMRLYKEPPAVRESSAVTYRANMGGHIIPFFGEMKLRDIKPLHIQAFITSISGLSKSVQTKCLQLLRGVFTSAQENGLIAASPMRKEHRPVGESTEEETPLSNEQAKQLLQAVQNNRAYTFCLIALSTGMRRGEILGLMWEDIDFQGGFINVTHNKAFLSNQNDAPVTTMLKTDSARRRIPLSPGLRDHLLGVFKNSNSAYVMAMPNGESLTKASFRSMWEVIEARTVSDDRALGDPVPRTHDRVTLDFKCHPHQLRHTYITQLFEAGLDVKQVQYLAGHATPDMTLRVYTHYRQRSREQETAQQVCAAVQYLGS